MLADDGTASETTLTGTAAPGLVRGTVDASTLAALQADLDAAALSSQPAQFDCTALSCSDRTVRRLTVDSGSMVQITVIGDLASAQLPAPLAKVFADLEAILSQVAAGG